MVWKGSFSSRGVPNMPGINGIALSLFLRGFPQCGVGPLTLSAVGTAPGRGGEPALEEALSGRLQHSRSLFARRRAAREAVLQAEVT